MNQRFKYPRTFHLPWSLGVSDDDKVIQDLSCFENMNIVVTIKMDGENTTMYNDYIHARSIDSTDHPSRSWVKSFWASIRNDIPDNYRICGENLYAQHSIAYDNLHTFFYGFSLWENETCLSWEETLDWFKLIGITPVSVIYNGKFDPEILMRLENEIDLNKDEGYVIRNSGSFKYSDFNLNTAKFVRKNHVQTGEHWMHSTIIPNKLTS